jgi:hypothetical protein
LVRTRWGGDTLLIRAFLDCGLGHRRDELTWYREDYEIIASDI